MVSQTIIYGLTDYINMVSQTITIWSHRPPIRIYNKIINKKGKFWRLWLKKVTTYHL